MEALLRNLKVLSANVSLRRNDDSESAIETVRIEHGKTRRPVVPHTGEGTPPA
jgi:hypothetical protein